MQTDHFKASGIQVVVAPDRLVIGNVMVWHDGMELSESRERWELAIRQIQHVAQDDLRQQFRKLIGVDRI